MNEKSASSATPEEQEQLIEIARMVVAMLGEKDIRLKQHAERVANLCANFCEHAGILSGDDLLHIYLAGLLRDTGYISIPREILKKDQPLSDEEMLLIKKHPVLGGADSLSPSAVWSRAAYCAASPQLLGLASETIGRVEEKVKEIIKDVAHLF